jgi:hypothetical protein
LKKDHGLWQILPIAQFIAQTDDGRYQSLVVFDRHIFSNAESKVLLFTIFKSNFYRYLTNSQKNLENRIIVLEAQDPLVKAGLEITSKRVFTLQRTNPRHAYSRIGLPVAAQR